MVVTDQLSKSIIVVPMKETRAIDVAQTLLEHIFQYHGLPTAIVSDCGTQFCEHVMDRSVPISEDYKEIVNSFSP